MSKIRIAVAGAGSFGRNHLRVIRESGRAELAAVVDTNEARARQAAADYGCRAMTRVEELAGCVDAVIVATPTCTHAPVAAMLLEAGMDVLVEKPIASDPAGARMLVETAVRCGRILQVGHLERFNPAVAALQKIVTLPLFFEIHRLSVFSPRSLDVDVVLDLMIHDIDIVLTLVGQLPSEIRAAGISILSPKVDIANVRLEFPGGCVANLTASRVSTERVRKLRLFQPHQYISLDYERRDVSAFSVSGDRQIGFERLTVEKAEPLRLEVDSFLDCVERRLPPRVTGEQAALALEAAWAILAKIEEHNHRVVESIKADSMKAQPDSTAPATAGRLPAS
ncbi:MAG: Gfo/Idh/MocA family oxidoreductase [Bryobacteraceae bacterium]